MKNNDIPRPFVKWAGGKRRLLNDIRNFYPDKIEGYIEPFVGGGAVYFDLIKHGKFLKGETVILNDMNHPLISVYRDLKENPTDLISSLNELQKTYFNENENRRKEIYYEKREKFRDIVSNKATKDTIEQSTIFIFLNKTGFNGMYRENLKGEFNIPFGRYKNPVLYEEENLKKISELLYKSKTNLLTSDFSKVLKDAKKGYFVYLDPPYYPIDETSNFTSYTKEDFGHREQERLRDEFIRLHKLGCRVLLSNSDVPEVRKLYDIKKECRSIHISSIEVGRSINSNPSKRGKVGEVLISNFNPSKV